MTTVQIKHFIIFALFFHHLNPTSLTMSNDLPNIAPEFPYRDFFSASISLKTFHSTLHSSSAFSPLLLATCFLSLFFLLALLLPPLLLPLLSRSFFPLAKMKSHRETIPPLQAFSSFLTRGEAPRTNTSRDNTLAINFP